MNKIYLDYNASTPLDPAVAEAMGRCLREEFGNPSNLHWAGAGARKRLEEAREEVANCLRCDPREVVFVSGGTESVNLALKGAVRFLNEERGRLPVHVVTSQVEHPSVLLALKDLEAEGRVTAGRATACRATVTQVGVDSSGGIDPSEIRRAICNETGLISVMFANNETGNIHPVDAIGRIAREKGILFHTDASQAVGKIPIDLSMLPVDLLSFSAHKICGPKGVGALFVRRGVGILPLIHGGGQEGERRAGTENLPAIVGMGCAIRRAYEEMEKESGRVGLLRDRLARGLAESVRGIRFHGDEAHRLHHVLNLSFEGISSEAILVALDREGIAVSSGSACASGAVRPSHVLLAMGVPSAEAKGAVRFSLGRWTTEEEIDCVLEKIPPIVERMRAT